MSFQDDTLSSSLKRETDLTHQTAARNTTMEARCRADISFSNMRHCAELFGEYDANLIYIENKMGVTISARGTDINIEGHGEAVAQTEDLLRDLYRKVECGETVDRGTICANIRALDNSEFKAATEGRFSEDGKVVPQVAIRTRKKVILPRTMTQAHYIMAMQRADVTFGLGPAGTGKTYLAVAQAVEMMITGKIEKLIMTRPAVEAGEKLGFLPGDMKDKVDPYLRPIYDALNDCLPPEQVERKIAAGEIEVAPLAFMRGRTLSNAFILLDEAQNTTIPQMKMFLTRFGEGSRMVICGDTKQVDLPGGAAVSGLHDVVGRLQGVEGIQMTEFTSDDVVRHDIVGRIVKAYEE